VRIHHRNDDDELREAFLVYPAEADLLESKISVLTPVGAALIGLRIGQSITWQAGDGSRHTLTVLSVIQHVKSTADD
jgi:regulator of nucleoside diphosphate kinase